MILTIDIGNTTIALGAVRRQPDGDFTVEHCGKLETVRTLGKAHYWPQVRHLLAEWGLTSSDFQGAALSSVVPSLVEPLGECAKEITGRLPLTITQDCNTGLTIDVKYPERVGRDRYVDAAWAAERYPLPVVTVDLGTATTFNVVNRERHFLGGIICAGIATSLKALNSGTAQLPALNIQTPDHVIGKDTAECMLAGAVAGAAALVDGLTAQVERELGEPATLVLTGGLSRFVTPLCHHPYFYEPDMMLKGLALLYTMN